MVKIVNILDIFVGKSEVVSRMLQKVQKAWVFAFGISI